MSSVRDTWRSMSSRSRLGAIAIAVAVVAGASGIGVLVTRQPAPTTPVADNGLVEPTAMPPGSTLPPVPPTPTPDPLATPGPTPSPTPAGADPLLGTDGRLTVLLLGSDYRPAHPGNRTDAIMVVSVDPSTGKTSAFSVPRDTTGFPLVNGDHFNTKINALYQWFAASGKDPAKAMEAAFSKAFGIEIDGTVLIGFTGVKSLVAAVGGVDVVLDKAYYDPDYWVTSKQQGWGLPAGKSHLTGAQALIFARSRKGDNDFGRARRQQILVAAAVQKVRTLGPGMLPRLLAIARDNVRTDLPLDRAAAIMSLVVTTNLDTAAKTVFGPTVYAQDAGGTSFTLKLDVCQHWIQDNFPPARPFGTWPLQASPAPSSTTPASAVSPTPTP